MAAGEVIGCFGLTEPDSGSDPASMRTHARRDGGDWILNGSKLWITNGSIADVAIVWARMPDDDGVVSAPDVESAVSQLAGVVSKRDAVVELRDLTLEVKARVARLVAEGMSFEEIVAAKPTADLDARWGARLDRFLPAVYLGLTEQN